MGPVAGGVALRPGCGSVTDQSKLLLEQGRLLIDQGGVLLQSVGWEMVGAAQDIWRRSCAWMALEDSPKHLALALSSCVLLFYAPLLLGA